jgi:hypothetical protein
MNSKSPRYSRLKSFRLYSDYTDIINLFQAKDKLINHTLDAVAHIPYILFFEAVSLKEFSKVSMKKLSRNTLGALPDTRNETLRRLP